MGTRRSTPLGVAAACVALALAVGLAGCDASSSGDGPATTAARTTSAPVGNASPSPSPSPAVTGFTTSCDDALPLVAVSQAAGQPIIGRTAFVVGEPDTTIGRLAYLNCRYGLPAVAPTGAAATRGPGYAVEIGVSLYDSAGRASTRVQGTVDDYRSSGSTAAAVAVGARSGTLLSRPGDPLTLVVADGSRTVAVTMIGSVYTGPAQLAAIAALAVDRAV